MADDAWSRFSERVAAEETLCVDAIPLAWPVPAALQLRMVERNGTALTAIAALEERALEAPDDDSPVMQELLRLDAKLSALVEIVNQLLVPASQLPPRLPVKFNAVGAVVPAALVPAGAAALVLRPRFDVCPAISLELAARVDRELPGSEVFVAFQFLGDVLGDAIERLVFRHHRRKVATARQLAG